MTDNDIIKALESYTWAKLYHESGKLPELDLGEVLKLVEHYEAEIEALKAEEKAANHYCKNSCEPKYKAEIERLEKNLKEAFAEIEALKQINLHCKAEAVKEFAERLKEKAHRCDLSTDEHEYYSVGVFEIDNLVKERVGEG